MKSVTRLQGGWGIAISFTRVDILCTIMGENDELKDVPYAEVAHWDDATHPRH